MIILILMLIVMRRSRIIMITIVAWQLHDDNKESYNHDKNDKK